MIKRQLTEFKKVSSFFAFNSPTNQNILGKNLRDEDISNHRHKILFVNM